MNIRVGINGFGRIGRSVFRVLLKRPDIEVVLINDLGNSETIQYLLKYDTVMGTLPQTVLAQASNLQVDKQSIPLYAKANPAEIPWGKHGVDVVVESTGRFTSRNDLEKHLAAGAKRVLLTVPPKDAIDNMVVLGVNDHSLKPEHRLVSNASCTTNCLAPVAKVLDEYFGIEYGLMTTIHAFTNDQRLLDAPHADLRRARAGSMNLIPTTTGAARAVGKILPQLQGKLDGMALRVGVVDGSCIDLTVQTRNPVDLDKLLKLMQQAANETLKGILAYSEQPLVSSDIVGNPHSSIFDAPLAQAIDKHTLRVVSWYDNEWGYSNRCSELITRLAHL